MGVYAEEFCSKRVTSSASCHAICCESLTVDGISLSQGCECITSRSVAQLSKQPDASF